MTDYYGVLGVAPDASESQIKSAFKRLAVKHHPDKSKDADHALFVRINEAYEVLKDASRRQEYDRKNRPANHNSFESNSFYNYYQTFSTKMPYTSFRNSQQKQQHESERRRREEEMQTYQQKLQRLAREEKLRQKAAEARREAEERERELKEQRRKFEAQSAARMAEKESLKRQQHAKNEHRSAYDGSAWDKSNDDYSDSSPSNNYYDNPFIKKEQYNTEKSEAYRRAWHGSGSNSSDPIVLSDDEVGGSPNGDVNESLNTERDHNQDRARNDENSGKASSEGPNEENDHHKVFNNFHDNLYETPLQNLESIFKLRSLYRKTTVKSPPKKKPAPKSFKVGEGKKFKPNTFSLHDLDDLLNEQEDGPFMKDLDESLPNTGHRKITEPQTPTSKRPKVSKNAQSIFTDGRAHAETMFRPLNSTAARGASSLTEKDWGADPYILQLKAPSPPNLDKLSADSLIKELKIYDEAFNEFKQHIINYQNERLKRDQMFQEMKYTPNGFSTYLKCVEQDAIIARKFSEAHNEYLVTMLRLRTG